MPLTGYRPSDINEAALQRLIDGQVPEGKTIDYKQELPGQKDGEKKEFLADLCSFANAVGGHILYGMKETDGIASSLPGLSAEIDAALLRMEHMAVDGIRPNIPGLTFARVPLLNGATAILACIPKSWNPPHQVVFQKDFRFYTRGSNGKQHIDVDELRRIVLLSQEIGERLRQFRAARVAAVMSDDTPVELMAGARQILHFVPLNAFGTGTAIDLQSLAEKPDSLIRALGFGGSSTRFNVDGILTFSPGEAGCDAYAQLYRNGIIEVARLQGEWTSRKGEFVLPSLSFEEEIFSQVSAALSALKLVGVSSPITVMLSFLGIKGWQMGIDDPYGRHKQNRGFDRDPLLIPEILLQPLESYDVVRSVKPMIDAVWNAAGYPKSAYYDAQGNWKH